jgi:hypothetical protein
LNNKLIATVYDLLDRIDPSTGKAGFVLLAESLVSQALGGNLEAIEIILRAGETYDPSLDSAWDQEGGE